MAFIESCFIRKNTPELRKKLEELGYKFSGADHIELDCIVTFPHHDTFSVFATYHFNIYDDNFKTAWKGYIDCGINEKLFLALAALRDDTPINSYYWFNDNLFKCEGLEIDRVLKNNTANYLLKCRRVDNPMIISCFKERNTIKATVEEIIEHFK